MTDTCGVSIAVQGSAVAASVSAAPISVSAATNTIRVDADPCAGGSVLCRKAVIAVAASVIAVSMAASPISVTTTQQMVNAVTQQVVLSICANVGYQGAAGAAGVGQREIYNQPTAPAVIAGHTLLWFKSGVTADPDDRELYLVE